MVSNSSETCIEAERWGTGVISRLQCALRENRLVILVGAGVTLQATSDASGQPLPRLTWKGLVRNGLDYLVSRSYVQQSKPRIRRAYESLDEVDPQCLLDAASTLTNLMQRYGQFPTWLEFVFSNLFDEVRHPAILDVLRALYQRGATLLTTNYDDLLERTCGINSVNRSDSNKFLRFKRGELQGVLHVHGAYHEPQEVVLDRTSYYQAKHSDEIQNLLKEFLDSKTILFVGCGSGIEDPNFGPLLDWAEDRQRNLPRRHCLLTRDGDDLAPSFLLPISYGSRYEDLSDFLKQLLDQPDQIADDPRAPGTAHRNSSTALTIDEKACLHALYPLGMKYEDQKNQNPRRVQNTCLWALSRPNYIQWRDGHDPQLLWISADAGCGKSVLSRTIVDEDLNQFKKQGGTVLYYFFKDTSEDQRSATRAIASLLHQLFESKPKLLRYALPKFLARGERMMSSLTELWTIFTEALASSDSGDVVCVLDALDECKEEEGRQLVTLIDTMFTEHGSIDLRMLITSRPYLSLQAAFAPLLEKGLSISIKGTDESDEIKKEIDAVIRYQVGDFANHRVISEATRDILEFKLLDMKQRTYLWLRLAWNLIRESFPDNEEELEEIITELPVGIMETYEKLLGRCRNQGYARKVLQIVLVAMRPLTLEEMDVVLRIDGSTTSLSQLRLIGSLRLRETLPGKCGNMITVIDSKIYFIHQTVKEFLLGGSIESQVSEQYINPVEGHRFMTEACTRRLTLGDVEWDSVNCDEALLPLTDRELVVFGNDHSLFAYAAAFWADHYKEIPREDDLVREMCDESRLTRDKFYFRGTGNFLSTAAFGGHKSIVELLLEKGANVNAQEMNARYGNALEVEILLEKAANFNAQEMNARYGNALEAASSGGHEQIVRLLIKHGADVNMQGGLYGSALRAASYCGHEQIVKLLIQHGANINMQGREHGSALQAASAEGHEQTIKLLINSGAAVDIQGGYYDSALKTAAGEGYGQIVRILIDHGADVNTQVGNARTVLQVACQNGHESIVRMLLDQGANPDAPGWDGTALQIASRKGHKQIVQLLLDKGAVATRGKRKRSWEEID